MTAFIRNAAAGTILLTALLFSTAAQALLSTHECGYCHSLHGSDTGFVPRTDQVSMEVLCLGCHMTANGSTAAVQPHRTANGSYPDHYVTCTSCHEVHDNMPNWRLNDPDHVADDNLAGRDGTDVRPDGWPVGVNTKMVGRQDPDGETLYAMILTLEADYDQNGVPDRNSSPTQTCNPNVVNDCYVSGKRHIIFENRGPSTPSIHGFADNDEDGVSPADALAGWGETITEWGDSAGAAIDSLCSSCHTRTSKNACGYEGAPGCDAHQSDATCTTCHTHAGCFDKAGCTAWSMPDRDVRMDSVSATPVLVNAGQTVTITADFTNLGTATEEVRVKFYSDIENYLGFTDVSGVAPGGGTGQANFDWVTLETGDHTLSAEAQPVLGEVVVANNSASYATPVTVASVDTHDIAVTSVVSPSPILAGDTETVTVNVTNQGTYTEGPFDVTLSSDLDGLIGTLSVTSLAPSASTALEFSWTTGANHGTHVLTGTAVISDDVPGNDSNTTSAVVGVHDVAVTAVAAPPAVEINSSTTVSVDITNQGVFTETFDVTLTSDQTADGDLPQVLSSGALGAGASTTLDFTWSTTGAELTVHTLTATAATVPSETDTADNTASTTIEVIPPTTHDVAVDSVTAPVTVLQGASETVSVQVSNNGGTAETFDVTLASDLDGTIQVLSSGALAAGNSTILDFTWSTGISTTPGLHTLTATAATVPGETNTADNSNTTTTTVQWHDVEAVSVTAPASTTEGDVAAVDVVVRNNGDFTETFDVTLVSDLDGSIQVLSSGALGAGAQTTLNFSWDTTGATVGTHTLTATAAQVTGELDTSNNAASTTAEVAASAAIHDVAVDSVTAPSSVTKGDLVTVSVQVSNNGTVPEIFNVTLTSDVASGGNLPLVLSSGTLAAGASTTLDFIWDTQSAGKRTHTLTATADTVPGETNTGDNVGQTSVTVN